MSFTIGRPQGEQTLYDVAIVGAGPGGSTAAIYAARARLKVIMVDKAKLGGALGITAKIANWPGSGYKQPLSGAELLREMHEHAIAFGAEFVQTQAYGVNPEGKVKEVYTAVDTYRANTLIIATGAGSRENKIPGEDEFLGRGVSHCATCDAAFFAGRTVAVLGNTQEAVEEALYLTKFARVVHVFTPAAKFLAEPEAIHELETNPVVELHNRHRIVGIEGDTLVHGLRVAQGGEETVVSVEGVFVYLPGNKPATGFLEGLVDLDERGFVITDDQRQTSQPGVFAVGDVRGAPVQQVVIAAADGCIAALAADRYINKRARTLSQR
ncbi:MAG: FAD-dependent oxidoreductase [Dehalococcoidales bacterium]|nr:FAD-dependent oxidoreductase [Dehalococcoidales bacterium]